MLGALAGLGVVLGVGFGRAGRADWVGRGFKVQKYTGNTKEDFQSTKVYSGNTTTVDFQSTKVNSRSTKIHFQITQSILSK